LIASGLAKLLDKAFVLGFALPALLFLTLLATVFGCPKTFCDTTTGSGTNPFAQLTYTALLVYVLAVALQAFNYWLYSIFGGYQPPLSWFGFSKAFHRWYLRTQDAKITALGDDPAAIVMKTQLRRAYPASEADVKPTAFGNAISAFEGYTYDVYRADAVPLWPRLLTVVSEDYQALIDDTKAFVDLWINLAALFLGLGLVSLLIAIAGAVRPNLFEALRPQLPIAGPNVGAAWYLIAIGALVVAFIAYRFATSLVPSWGECVDSAFDCFLPTLAKQLGYDVPRDTEGRRTMWTHICEQILYGTVQANDAKVGHDAAADAGDANGQAPQPAELDAGQDAAANVHLQLSGATGSARLDASWRSGPRDAVYAGTALLAGAVIGAIVAAALDA
jgi:hypothetical protein